MILSDKGDRRTMKGLTFVTWYRLELLKSKNTTVRVIPVLIKVYMKPKKNLTGTSHENDFEPHPQNEILIPILGVPLNISDDHLCHFYMAVSPGLSNKNEAIILFVFLK